MADSSGIRIKEGEIEVSQIKPFIHRNRDRNGFNDLVKSIEKYGLLIPITVVEETGGYTLVKGEGRVEAHRALKQSMIKAFIFSKQDWNEGKMIIDWLVENKVREKLSTYDKARLLRIVASSEKSLLAEAKKLEINPATAKQYVSTIEQASDRVLDAVEKNKLSFTTAKELVSAIKNKKSQGTTVEVIIGDNLGIEDARVVIHKAKMLERGRKGSISLEELRRSLRDIAKERREVSQILNKTNNRLEILRNAAKEVQEDAKFLVLLKEVNIDTYKEE